jgi:ABC-type molybdate transport system ATPase subunit
MLGIGHLLARKPQGLSGGERQRVVLGRALSFQPKILCLDEPLSALDDDTRDEMYGLLKSIQEKTGVTTLHVTHSQESARRLANRTLVLNGGVITAQSG